MRKRNVGKIPETASEEREDTLAVPDTEATEARPTGSDKQSEPGDGDAEPVAEMVQGTADKPQTKRRIAWSRVIAFGVLPGLALLLAAGAGFAKWQDSSARNADVARIESVAAARDSTIAILSYRPDTVEKDLGSAQDRLTGEFRDSYLQLTRDVVIPGAKQKQISAVATVPAAASVSADANHAVVLVFVNQTTIVGQDAPTASASSVRIALDKVHGRWLISAFDPI